ncbi:hypothetical protein [Nocardia harenae]|uniref:hypothetical protein n=1 Tax=Nocardia harenae TaxID=358707 RepID=UPI000834A0F9|nr:hypothetical protein [Nocardia harenae]
MRTRSVAVVPSAAAAGSAESSSARRVSSPIWVVTSVYSGLAVSRVAASRTTSCGSPSDSIGTCRQEELP